jgi:hypothetical protein
MKTEAQKTLRDLVKIRDEYQAVRKRVDNRMGRKADGTLQSVEERKIDPEVAVIIGSGIDVVRTQEKAIEKELAKRLKPIPIYAEWLSKQKGVGPISAGWILAEFDIHIAETVSKLWQYAGLNPGLVFGKKRIDKEKYKESMGPVTEEFESQGKDGKKKLSCIYVTDEKIRGDRATPGFVLPYNKRLKTALMGVLASSFIKSRAPYRLEYYDTYKERLKNREGHICNPDEKRNRQDDGKQWNKVSDGHRDMAAKRYMIKMFLKDLYVAWREIEGLTVRKPYAEDYLGRKHDA